jgi:hypothetical protein
MQSTGVRTRDRQKLVLLAAQFSVGSQQRGIGQHGENEKIRMSEMIVARRRR